MSEFYLVSTVLLWVIVLFNLLLTLALVKKINSSPRPDDSPSPIKGLQVGQQAPQFTAQTLGGEEVVLADYAGREVVLLFIEPNCIPCREALPQYEALAPKAKRAGVEFILVSTGDQAETQALADKFNITMPVLVAPHQTNPLKHTYKVTGTPAYCLINSQGKIQSADFPSFSAGKWKALVASWESYDRQADQIPASVGG